MNLRQGKSKKAKGKRAALAHSAAPPFSFFLFPFTFAPASPFAFFLFPSSPPTA
jgi:hypothetical protein